MAGDSLSRGTGRAYWRSLEEYAATPEFRAWAEAEFPALATELDASYAEGGTSRRRFLQLMGASIALAGMAGCRRREEKILAYNKKSPETIPGRAMYYATTMVLAGQPIGVLAETHEGRPTKIEGNPLHPASGGATHVFAQASVLDLYDPDRSRSVLHAGKAARYKEGFLPALEKIAADLKGKSGAGLAILSEDFASPALEMLREHLATAMPKATYHVYEPAGSAAAGYRLEKADVILALDCDFLGLEDEGVRLKREFASRRRISGPKDEMSRLYVVEPGFTTTGAAADHRLRLGASRIGAYVGALAATLEGKTTSLPGVDGKWLTAVAEDLKKHAGRCVVMAGRRQPAGVRAAVAEINRRLGNIGKTVEERGAEKVAGIAELAERIKQGAVTTLVILGGNPAYSAPADLQFGDLIKKVPTTIRLGLHEDETSQVCTWHVPAAHYLESWGDAVSADGCLSPVQPMIEPLFDGKTPLELLARIGGYTVVEPYEIVRQSFARFAKGGDFERSWREYLHKGCWKTDVAAAKTAELPTSIASAADVVLSLQNMEVCFAVSDSVFDGRFANNGWMQECPEPMTKLTWDNAAMVSPRTARELAVKTGDVVKIEVGGRSLETPVFVLPGHADYSVTLPLGYGRRSGTIADGVGFDAYALRTSGAMGFVAGAKVTKVGRTHKLATTQEHWSVAEHHVVGAAVKERAIVREGTLEDYRHHPDFAQHMGVHTPKDKRTGRPLTIYTPPKMEGPQQWGMVIDLNTCVGCNACVVACQAENNIPIVGKDEVLNGREMHWMRQDRYFQGDDPEGEVSAAMQPMLCQHCENAPCEPVCPVNATVHSPEGLNEMVYNRCIGTRYCANNCPYKVRRFNFFDFNKGTINESRATRDGKTAPDPMEGFSRPQILQPAMHELVKMQKNPQVTIRMRGVMEKCTFCVQRIEQAKIEARLVVGQNGIKVETGSGVNRANSEPDGRPAVKVADGVVQTACQQACPTQAIVFGDMSDPKSRVSQGRRQQRNYEVLEHLNVRPRTTYLARVRNVNPAMSGREGGHA